MAEENFSRHFSRFYDEAKNSCIKYKGEVIKEWFEGELDNLRITYEWNTIRYPELNEVFSLIDEKTRISSFSPFNMNDKDRPAMSEVARHNQKVFKEWMPHAERHGSKSFAIVGADINGEMQIFSPFDNARLLTELRTVIKILEEGRKVMGFEITKN